MKTGFAASIAKGFINSKLTVILMIVFLSIGAYSTWLIPREEEPQINLPSADIFVQYPGASADEVDSRIVEPLQTILTNIQGVEYVYATALPEKAVVSVLFYVGEDEERSLVKLFTELDKHMDELPSGVSPPLIKSRTIDDVPILNLTLWSSFYSDYELKRVAQEMESEIKQVTDVAHTEILGGRSRAVRIMINKERMRHHELDALTIAQQLQSANWQLESGSFNKGDTEYLVRTGLFLNSVEDVKNLVVGVVNGQPVYLHQVAEIKDGPEESNQYVRFGLGQHFLRGKGNMAGGSSKSKTDVEAGPGDAFPPADFSAVTLAISKRPGADAMRVADRILEKVEFLKTNLIPSEIEVTVSRNYGETASRKVNELLFHLFGAILAVSFLVWLSLGWRGALVVFLSVPVTFALTLFIYYLFGYTLNRITLFALVFVTGIVVDDSIIIAENIHRHFKIGDMPFLKAALKAIDEVGNPTILATFIVVASILPMAFVRGLMGPYMSPMPIGASMAMLFSLIIALTITPWLSYYLLRVDHKVGEKRYALKETKIYKFYLAVLGPFLESKRKRFAFLGLMTLVLIASGLLVYFKMVALKMLPFDDKNEFQVVIDMPEGTTLERTAAVTADIAAYIRQQPEVVNYQTYAGTHSPITFNGLVRHYDLRRGSNVADIQVNLIDKTERSRQSHDIAKRMRPEIQAIAERHHANVKVVEIPPGPPVLSTLVAEIYGPDLETQYDVARQVKQIFEETEGVVDVDWMVEEPQPKYLFEVNKEKAMLAGISTQQVAQTLTLALKGRSVGRLYEENEKKPLPIQMQLSERNRSGLEELKNISIQSAAGVPVSLGDIVEVRKEVQGKNIYRKNLKRVIYVTGDVSGKLESPVYEIMDMEKRLKNIQLPEGYNLDEYFTKQPFLDENYALKWDGEWHITYEVFRDLGAAFAVALIVIYLLIVGWFQDLTVPLVMLIAVPLSLIGILLGHWMMGAFFSATSMIGMIALAGIMVRNSVLLIDFINLRLAEGAGLKDAVLESAAVRTTPILLTAGTVVLGAFVILFDPIFQGLAISLMGGSIVSTALTLLIVPMVYYMMKRKKLEG